VIGYLLADEIGWRSEGIDLASIATHRSTNISETSQRGFSMQLVDVRSQAEWKRGHLPGAVFVPLLNLASETNQIDRSRTTLVYCREGYRATTAASILLRRCSDNVAILGDGVEGWSALGLPLAMASDPSIDPFSAPLNKCSFDRV
jgi:hydroxyacylglutathione hydrolase